MTRYNTFIIICVLACLSHYSFASGSNAGIRATGMDEARKKAEQEGKLIFVYFHADWCKPCQWMEQTTFSNHRVDEMIAANFIKLNADIDEFNGFELKKAFDVKFLPTLMVFNSKGQILDRIEETLTPSKMLTLLNKHNTIQNKSIIRHDLNQSPRQAQILTLESKGSVSEADEYKKHFLKKQTNKVYRVQVGVFTKYQGAEEFVKTLTNLTTEAVTVVQEYKDDEPIFKVRIGQFDTPQEAEIFRNLIAKQHDLHGLVM